MCAKEGGISSELNEVLETCLTDDTTDPRTEVVHFSNATIRFSAMVSPVRLEIHALGAPIWTPIKIAYESILPPKVLTIVKFGLGSRYKALMRRSWMGFNSLLNWHNLVELVVMVRVMPMMPMPVASPMAIDRLCLLRCTGSVQWAPRRISWVCNNCLNEPPVTDQDREQEDIEQDKHHYRWTCARVKNGALRALGTKQVIN